MGIGTRRWLTISILTVVMIGLLVLIATHLWYGIVASILLWVIAIFPDWEYLVSFGESDAGGEM